jgi:hypothetical protein
MEKLSSCMQGCHKGQFWRKITVRTSARIRVYPADGFLPSADAVKTTSAWTHPCPRGRWGASALTWASARTHLPPIPSPSLPPPPSPSLPSAVRADAKKQKKQKKTKYKINNFFLFFLFFWVNVAGLEREKKFTIFGFQSPKSPKSLEYDKTLKENLSKQDLKNIIENKN